MTIAVWTIGIIAAVGLYLFIGGIIDAATEPPGARERDVPLLIAAAVFWPLILLLLAIGIATTTGNAIGRWITQPRKPKQPRVYDDAA